MNLDDLSAFRAIDRQNLISQINDLPDQLASAYQLGQEAPLPDLDAIQGVAICGMGASVIAAEILAAYAAPNLSVPLAIVRDYDLPGWCRGPHTLVIAVSHSGNTEETLSIFEQALERGCQALVLTTGGKLAEAAGRYAVALWRFPPAQIPRLACGYFFGLLHSLFGRLGLLPDPQPELADLLQALRGIQASLRPEVSVVHNPAKRMAGQMLGRPVIVFGADFLAPLAKVWKNQINGMAHAMAISDAIPEADHNTLAGLEGPAVLLPHLFAIFLESPENHPRNLQRLQLTRQVYLQQGINTDVIQARGKTRLAGIWTSILFADYCTYYLAMAYGVDPSTATMLNDFKAELAIS